MAKNIINIQSDEFVVLANKLEKIGRADLPVAVRGTLNEMAFRMKGSGGKRGQIDKRAESDFDYRRNKSLFKAITGVDKAQGLNIGSMKSEAGIVNRSGMNDIAEGLADQQKGGTTDQKATPLTRSRVGKQKGRKVRGAMQLQKQSKAIKIEGKRGRRYVQLALRAERSGRPVIITGRGGTKYLARVRGFTRKRKEIKFKMEFLYRMNQSGKVKLKKKRPFVDNAAKDVMKQGPNIFQEQAKKRIDKAFRK